MGFAAMVADVALAQVFGCACHLMPKTKSALCPISLAAWHINPGCEPAV